MDESCAQYLPHVCVYHVILYLDFLLSFVHLLVHPGAVDNETTEEGKRLEGSLILHCEGTILSLVHCFQHTNDSASITMHTVHK